jgi:opacity protein-like surface antigen
VSRFQIGPVVEYDFNEFFGGEANLLYNRMSFDALVPPTAADAVAVSNTRAHALDIPLLIKWKPWGDTRDFSPYVDAGVSLRYVNSNETRRFFGGDDEDAEFDRSFAQVNSFNAGFTLSGGVAFNAGERVRLSPELRWTAWGRDNFKAPSLTNPAGEQLDDQNNQLELLLGITF